MRLAALALAFSCGVASASEEPGKFDYWVLALTWSPQFCAQHEADPQCLRGQFGFVVHGLWPQFEHGYPDYCGRAERVPRELVERMLPLIHGDKLIEQEWRKHGTCSGMTADEYFRTVERARRAIAIPEAYVDPEKYVRASPAELVGEFIAVNPGLGKEALALQCAGRWLKEARFCFDKEFHFRACGEDVAGECDDEVVIRPNRPGHVR